MKTLTDELIDLIPRVSKGRPLEIRIRNTSSSLFQVEVLPDWQIGYREANGEMLTFARGGNLTDAVKSFAEMLTHLAVEDFNH